MTDTWTCGHSAGAMCAECHRLLAKRATELTAALVFIKELAGEELPFVAAGTGAEVTLRHIKRRARDALAGGATPPNPGVAPAGPTGEMR